MEIGRTKQAFNNPYAKSVQHRMVWCPIKGKMLYYLKYLEVELMIYVPSSQSFTECLSLNQIFEWNQYLIQSMYYKWTFIFIFMHGHFSPSTVGIPRWSTFPRESYQLVQLQMISTSDENICRSKLPGSGQDHVCTNVWCSEAYERPQSELPQQSQVKLYTSHSFYLKTLHSL